MDTGWECRGNRQTVSEKQTEGWKGRNNRQTDARQWTDGLEGRVTCRQMEGMMTTSRVKESDIRIRSSALLETTSYQECESGFSRNEIDENAMFTLSSNSHDALIFTNVVQRCI
jgi:hypothetical protein